MSDITNSGVIDLMQIEDRVLVLYIYDTLEWDYASRGNNQNMLVGKVNDYISFIQSGQVYEHKSKEDFDSIVIRVEKSNPSSRYVLSLYEKIRGRISELCGFEWNTLEGDGFEDFVFDIEKVYPRLKKNWAEDPLNDIRIMNYSTPDGRLNAPAYRLMDSYIGLFIQDVGEGFVYLDYDMIPDDIDADTLSNKAFENLARDVRYEIRESRIEGIYGLLCGGDFEAEALLDEGIWETCAESVGGDLVIAVPTKDLVFFTRADDKKKTGEILALAAENFERNLKETPELVFSKDVFVFTRESGKIELSSKYRY